LAVAVIERDRAGSWAPLFLKEVRPPPGYPLDLRNVLIPIAREVRTLGCESWASDGFAPHDVMHAGLDGGLSTAYVGSDLLEQWRHLLAISARGQHALGPSPRIADDDLEALASQLGTVEEVFVNGRRTVRIQEIGSSHGDLASAYSRAFWHAKAADYVEPPTVPFDPLRYGGRSRYDTGRGGRQAARR
jgi:hypothetical protein